VLNDVSFLRTRVDEEYPYLSTYWRGRIEVRLSIHLTQEYEDELQSVLGTLFYSNTSFPGFYKWSCNNALVPRSDATSAKDPCRLHMPERIPKGASRRHAPCTIEDNVLERSLLVTLLPTTLIESYTRKIHPIQPLFQT